MKRLSASNQIPRVVTTASSATPTPDADITDHYQITALAAGATFGAPTGTPFNGQSMIIRIKDNGTARTLAWNAAYRAIGYTLPTTTVISKTLYVGIRYNSADSKWDVLSIGAEDGLNDYIDFTPALTAVTTNPTLGTGGSATGNYTQIGKFINGTLTVQFGTSGTNAGSGNYHISIPKAASSSASILGFGWLFDSSASAFKQVIFHKDTSTRGFMYYEGAAGVITNTTHAAPWAWGPSDLLILNFSYRADTF